ncbi:MAG: ABC transporter permease [Alphaproteobacteria bacterium]|nr:ABC transporter permease [Alphaproteobacteria bacterium]
MARIARFLGRRLVQAAGVILGIAVINFLLVHLAPGDAVEVLAGEAGGAGDPGYVERLRARFGLDRPLHEQLALYLWNVVRLDFGYSFRHGTDVLDLILGRVPATLLLMVTSIAAAFLLGLVLGVTAARRVNTVTDNVIALVALLSYAIPLFWLGLMLVVLFSVMLGWLPSGGISTVGVDQSPLAYAADVARHAVLPTVTLTLFYMAVYTRLMRASMLEVTGHDFVRTARAKGLSERAVIWRHVLKNALLPMVTMIGMQVGSLLGGAVMVEMVFGWPGLGRLAFEAILARDLNLLLGILLLSSILVVAANILVDLAYAWLDPRIEVR